MSPRLKAGQLREEIAFEPLAEGPHAKPFVKWAGGKRSLLDELRKHVPPAIGTYFEPFVGGGALFFDLCPPKAILGDANLPLVMAYAAIRDNVDEVIRILKIHEARHSLDHYLETRRTLIWEGRPLGPAPNVAARLIYLNKTCFNGLWRVNKKGEFNVPMGRYENPLICDAPNLRACARALAGAGIFHQDFAELAENAARGDFVYFDPPYIPAREGSFVGYAKEGFTVDDQIRLVKLALGLKARGVSVLLTNSDTPQTRKLYTGFNARRVEVKRAINSDASKRGAVGELIIW